MDAFMHYNVGHKVRREINEYRLSMMQHVESPTRNHKFLFVDTVFAYTVPLNTVPCWFFLIGHFEICRGFPHKQCWRHEALRKNGVLFRILWYGLGLLFAALGIKRCMFL